MFIIKRTDYRHYCIKIRQRIKAYCLQNSTEVRPELYPTDLRTAPLYTMYFNWSRLIVHGILPFVMLVYLNAKIYQVNTELQTKVRSAGTRSCQSQLDTWT